MSSVTGVSLNAIFPSGLVDRQPSALSSQPRIESPLFVPVGESQATARQENRREINPDQRRRGNDNRSVGGSANGFSSGDDSGPVREQSRQELEKAQREGDLSRQEAAQLRELQELARRDREVRTHEQAHKAIAGQYAGPVRYEYEQGPDGRRYAVEGSVNVDLRPAEDPRQTVQKMEQILRAALAPSEPSPADRQIAAEANQLIMEARSEALKEQRNQGDSERNREDVAAGSSPEPDTVKGRNERVGTQPDAGSEDNRTAVFASPSDNGAERAGATGTPGQDPDRADSERRARLDEQRSIMNTEAQARLIEVQAAIAELLRNQGTSLNEVQLGRNVNFQI